MSLGNGKIRMHLAIDPGSTTGVALLEPVSGLWRATEVVAKGTHTAAGGSLDGVASEGAVMYLDEVQAAADVCTWVTAALKDLYMDLRLLMQGEFDEVDGWSQRSASDRTAVVKRLSGGRSAAGAPGFVASHEMNLGWSDGDLFRGDLIVVEDFILRLSDSGGGPRSSKRSSLSAPRLSAALYAWFSVMDWTPALGVRYKLQTAANAKHIVKDDRLKRAGMWVRGKEHARDALRHALLSCR